MNDATTTSPRTADPHYRRWDAALRDKETQQAAIDDIILTLAVDLRLRVKEAQALAAIAPDAVANAIVEGGIWASDFPDRDADGKVVHVSMSFDIYRGIDAAREKGLLPPL